jgi:hypothetical protein
MSHIPKIIIKLIGHPNQRMRGEIGDWFYDKEDDTLTIFVSRMDDWRSELGVAVHEAFESAACIAAGIDQTDVDAWDKQFHEQNSKGEAGDCIGAPYASQHKSATAIERIVCQQLDLDWRKHEGNCENA